MRFTLERINNGYLIYLSGTGEGFDGTIHCEDTDEILKYFKKIFDVEQPK